MKDIVERLRYTAQVRAIHRSDDDPIKLDCLEAIAEIERLRLLLEMSHKKFATLKAAYDMEMRKPIVLCGSAAPGGDA